MDAAAFTNGLLTVLNFPPSESEFRHLNRDKHKLVVVVVLVGPLRQLAVVVQANAMPLSPDAATANCCSFSSG